MREKRDKTVLLSGLYERERRKLVGRVCELTDCSDERNCRGCTIANDGGRWSLDNDITSTVFCNISFSSSSSEYG